jgi:transposase
LLASELDLPFGFVLTGGHTHDRTHAITLLGDRRPEAVLADKGYDTDPILNHLAKRGIKAVIPPRSMRKEQLSSDRTVYRQRNRIERTFAHLKQLRRLATRFDKLKRHCRHRLHITMAQTICRCTQVTHPLHQMYGRTEIVAGKWANARKVVDRGEISRNPAGGGQS